MAFLRVRQREILVVVLLACVVWVRQLMVGEMNEEIQRLASPSGLPAKRLLLAKVRQAEQDAREVAKRLEDIRRQPLPGVNLASTLERFHRDRQIQPARSRLNPRPAQPLEMGLNEESVEVTVTSMTLEEVIEYLSALEQLGPALRIRVLRMQKTQDTLGLTMVVAALRP